MSKANGLPDARLTSIWVTLPDDDGPFSEIVEYQPAQDRAEPRVDAPGSAHLAFAVTNIHEILADIASAGGRPQGEITNFGSPDAPLLIVYVRDPEGNILGLEQH